MFAMKLASVLSLRSAIRLKFLELAEKVLDQVTSLIHLAVDVERLAASRVLGNDGFGAARIDLGENGVGIEGHVPDPPKATPSRSGGTGLQ